MARSKSAVLSPADKKAVVTDIKNKIKEATAAQKATAATFKLAERAFAAASKLAEKEMKTVGTALAKLNSDLAAITQQAA